SMGQAEQVRKFREVVNNQMDVLRSLDPPDRILWSEKLNMLAGLIPPDVFLDEVKVVERVDLVETEQSKAAREAWRKNDNSKKGPEPKIVYRPVISYNLFITGLALGDNHVEQFNNVMAFHKAMIDHEEPARGGETRRFMDGFRDEIQFES